MKCHYCSAKAGPISKVYCDYHAGYHNGVESYRMREVRKDPNYREAEREAVKKRMRRLRRVRAAKGLGPIMGETPR